MKSFGLLLVVFLAAADAQANTNSCTVTRGVRLQMFSGNFLNMEIPCKYNFVDSVCGGYKVVISPGNRYLYPSYIMDTIWVNITRISDGVFYAVRTENRVAAKFILKLHTNPFNLKNTNDPTITDDLFEMSRTEQNVTLKEKDNTFSITFTPFDMNGGRHSDNKLEYRCNAEQMPPVEYPKQFCGGINGSIPNQRAKSWYGHLRHKDRVVILDVLNDSSIVQTDPKCQKAARLMQGKCRTRKNDTEQQEAARICHVILTSEGHRNCAMKYACDPMDVFNACLDYVCGGYDKDSDSCEEVARAIDLCRNFTDLTEPVKQAHCFTDFLTQGDNIYYKPIEETDEE